MHPQAAAAVLPDESPKVLPKQETAVEATTGPESPIEKALEGGPENVVNFFEGRAQEEKAALERLGQLDTNELAAAPAEAAQVQVANDNAEKSIANAEELAIKKVAEVIPMTRAETPEIVEVKPEAVPKVTSEAEIMEAASADSELIHEAEALKAHEQEQIKAELAALDDFSKDHPHALDRTIPDNIKVVLDNETAKLNETERLYADTIVAGHKAANTSLRHAETLLAAYALPENDPQRAELMAKAETLLEQAQIDEVAAQFLKGQYMKLPEIAALVPSGSSMGGGGDDINKRSNFHAHDSPYEKPPSGPIQAAGVVLGTAKTDKGGEGIADLTVEGKMPGGPVEKKPSFIDRWFRKNVSDLTGGAVDANKSSRE